MKITEFKQLLEENKRSFQLCFQGIKELNPSVQKVKLTSCNYYQAGKQRVLKCPKRMCQF